MRDETTIFINPLTDFGFKYLFGRHADREFILSFLNALKITPSPIKDVKFIDKEKKGESKDDRAIIYDLNCELEDGSKMIVEMQNRYQTHFADRALYYLSADVYGQGEKGEGWDYQLTPVYGIFLMNFEWRDKEEQHIREDICLYNMQKKQVFSEKMKMTFLKIPMMEKEAEECKTTLERWLYILKNMEKMEAIPQTFMNEPVFKRLGKVARYAALDKEQQAAYKASLKVYRDNYAILKTEREEGFAEGEASGFAKGEASGFAKGEASGFAKGEAKGEERTLLKSIKIMRELGVSVEMIAEKYQMSVTDVERLLDRQKQE